MLMLYGERLQQLYSFIDDCSWQIVNAYIENHQLSFKEARALLEALEELEKEALKEDKKEEKIFAKEDLRVEI